MNFIFPVIGKIEIISKRAIREIKAIKI